MDLLFISLKPWEERSETAKQLVDKLNAKLASQITNATAFAFGPPAIQGLGASAGFSLMNKFCENYGQFQIQSVIIEGGSKTLQQFIEKNIWNEARVFISPESLLNGVNAPKLHLKPSHQEKIIQDTLLTYYNTHD